MKRLTVLTIALLCLVVPSCGGSEGSAGAAGPDTTVDERADGLIARLGSDPIAADALILAMERGYSTQQILDGVNSDLAADGSIAGQSPASPALGLVSYNVEGDGEGAFPGVGAEHEVRLVAAFQIEQTPIERLRQNADQERGVGETMTFLILARLDAGFSPRDVVEMLILGVDELVDDPNDPDGSGFCLRVVDELDSLQPFGHHNRVPRFRVDAVELVGAPRLVGKNEEHLIFRVRQQGQGGAAAVALKAVFFRAARWALPLSQHRGSFGMVVELKGNEFRGTRTPELMVIDVDLGVGRGG